MGKVPYGEFVIAQHGKRWRFQARVNGQKVRPSFPTLDEAKAAIDQLVLSRGGDPGPAWVAELGSEHLTVRELVERWLAWKTDPGCDEPIRPRTVRDYRRCIDVHIGPLIGNADAATISSADLKREFFRVCSSRTAARFSRTILQQAFRWAIEERVLGRTDNPCVDVRLGRLAAGDGRIRKASSVRAVTDAEIPNPGEIQKMLVWSLETGRRAWWLWVYIAATAGLRPSEVCALRTEDFDPQNQRLIICRSAPDRSDPGDWHPKTGTSIRTLALGAEFFDTVVPHLPPPGSEDEDWLFPARSRGGGRPQRTHTATPCWPNDAPNREMRRMRRQLGLSESYRPYSLRHFVATRLILQGQEEIQVARFLGTSVEMLQKVYANHLDRDAQRQIGEAVTRMF